MLVTSLVSVPLLYLGAVDTLRRGFADFGNVITRTSVQDPGIRGSHVPHIFPARLFDLLVMFCKLWFLLAHDGMLLVYKKIQREVVELKRFEAVPRYVLCLCLAFKLRRPRGHPCLDFLVSFLGALGVLVVALGLSGIRLIFAANRQFRSLAFCFESCEAQSPKVRGTVFSPNDVQELNPLGS